ncbi:hypothetical protein V6N13_124160 [Hibiscus sabdariffa]
MKITFDKDLLSRARVCSLKPKNPKEDDDQQTRKELSVENSEGNYFVEWTLLGQKIGSLSAITVGDATCALLATEKFDSVVGSLTKLSQDDHKSQDYYLDVLKASTKEIDISTLAKTDPRERIRDHGS